MKMVKCAHCDQLHPISMLEPSFRMPDAILEAMRNGVPQLAPRDMSSGVVGFSLSGDMAVFRHTTDIDHLPYCYLRCTIPLPLVGSKDFYCVGSWVKVSFDDFEKAVATWDSPSALHMPLVDGVLANAIPGVSNSLGAAVKLEFHVGMVPTAGIATDKCSLQKDQLVGITLERIAEFTSYFRPAPGDVVDVPVH